jgi:DNA-binding transcriptional MerR regulator
VTRFYDRGADELQHIDLEDDRLTYPEAATLAGVPVTTVRQWKSRGDLKPVEIDDNGRLRFRPIDVLRAEAKTRMTRQGRKRQAS